MCIKFQQNWECETISSLIICDSYSMEELNDDWLQENPEMGEVGVYRFITYYEKNEKGKLIEKKEEISQEEKNRNGESTIMEFKVNVVLEQEDFCGLAIMNAKRKKAYVFNRVLQILIALFIFYGVLLLIRNTLYNFILYNKKVSVTDMIIYIMVLYLPYLLIFGISGKRLGKKMWKKYVDKGSNIDYIFSEDYMMIVTPKTEEKSKYGLIKNIYEDKVRYYLFVNDFSAHIIRKEKFREEEREKFKSFIEQKTNLKFIQV